MAKNVSLLGANYPDVPAVQLPQTGGGSATFTDVSDTTATENDVEDGKVFYTSAGIRSVGSGTKLQIVRRTITTDANGNITDLSVTSGYIPIFAYSADTSGDHNDFIILRYYPKALAWGGKCLNALFANDASTSFDIDVVEMKK
jgi:hypothetical protein